jgi:hypothetical protein
MLAIWIWVHNIQAKLSFLYNVNCIACRRCDNFGRNSELIVLKYSTKEYF